MSTRAISRPSALPTIFDDFFRPWNQWFDEGLMSRVANMPAVNIKEEENHYMVSLAAPGLAKTDFKINVDRNMLTILSEKDESKEEKQDKYTRKEYSYSSFSRSFTLPEDVKQEAIDARYENGELKITLPRRENGNKETPTKNIIVK